MSERYYGEPPKELGQFKVEGSEFFYHLYMPIKLPTPIPYYRLEDRLLPLTDIVQAACEDYLAEKGLIDFTNTLIYLTAWRMFVDVDKAVNREGWHGDGFGTPDFNYIWCDSYPTIFNPGPFHLSADDSRSMKEMQEQADESKNYSHEPGTLLRLDQYNIHKVAPITHPGVRTFLKLSFSKDVYNLKGNGHNYLLDYKWDMRERRYERNTPQQLNDVPVTT